MAALFLILLVLFAPQLAAVGLEFQPWDFFMLVMFALTVTSSHWKPSSKGLAERCWCDPNRR